MKTLAAEIEDARDRLARRHSWPQTRVLDQLVWLAKRYGRDQRGPWLILGQARDDAPILIKARHDVARAAIEHRMRLSRRNRHTQFWIVRQIEP